MTDARQRLLAKFADAATVVTKQCGISLDDIVRAFSDSYNRVEIPPTTSPAESGLMTVKQRNLFARMISVWRRRSEFVDEDGEPILLPASGAALSLVSLFETAAASDAAGTAGATPAVAIATLESHGAIHRQEDGRYALTATAFVVNANTSAGAVSNLSYLAEYAGTIAHNAYGGQGGRFNRVARTVGFPENKLPVVVAMLEERGTIFLQQVDQFIMKEKENAGDVSGKRKVAVGLFLIDEPITDHD